MGRHTLWAWPGWPGARHVLPLGGVWCPGTHALAVTLLDLGPGDTPCLQGALWVCLRTAMSVNIKGTARGTSGTHWVLPLSSPLLPLILQPRAWGWLVSAGGWRGQEWAHGGGEVQDSRPRNGMGCEHSLPFWIMSLSAATSVSSWMLKELPGPLLSLCCHLLLLIRITISFSRILGFCKLLTHPVVMLIT